MTRNIEVKAEENFPITVQNYIKGKLLDDTECDILVDIGTSKSYMSKSYFLRCKFYIHCLNLPLQPQEFKLEMDNM